MNEDWITAQVSERYSRAATTGERMCCPGGYNFEDLRGFIPDEILNIAYGCGTPAGIEQIHRGETVLDIGSGGGIDCFEASRRVGPTGRVIGIDMTDAMLEIATRNAPVVAAKLGYEVSNVEFRKGAAEKMPVDENSVDVVISNCVINLAPDKRKVFREMYRVIKPGGRFTISDIVSDRELPKYLIYDQEKWGNCLSGALHVRDYTDGLVQAGFHGVHQVKVAPWQVIDGINFLSLTLTGYKLPLPTAAEGARFATLRGPFSSVMDESGQVYRRGMPRPVTQDMAQLLCTPPCRPHFLLSAGPVPLESLDPRWQAVLPEDGPCLWQGHFALFTGPFLEVSDDDQHRYERGRPLEICSKTLKVLQTESYRPHFAIINRAQSAVNGTAVSCVQSEGCC